MYPDSTTAVRTDDIRNYYDFRVLLVNVKEIIELLNKVIK